MQKILPSKEQDAIIKINDNTIVVSNPGTGKTTTLSWKVMNLLENKVKPEDILCITFTEKAKKEMFNKIFEMSKGKFPDSEIMKINIHTFHSFAYNYLVDLGIVSREIIGNNFLRFSILNSFEKNNAFTYGKEYIISEMVPKAENAIRYIKNFGITPDKINIENSSQLLDNMYKEIKSKYTIEEVKAFLKYFVEAYKDYEISKKNSVDYSDMLLIFIEKFQGKKFPFVLVDEMQDMNELEAKIVEMVGETIFLVGDAKQAIFGFQGGSVKNFAKFQELCKPMLLSENRRSSQQILDYSKSNFLSRTLDKENFSKQLEFFRSSMTGEIPKIISTNAHLTAILDIIDKNPGKSIAIITRKNRQIIEVSQFLDINNIQYSSTSSQATAELAKDEIIGFLKGMISDKLVDKISATFTIFSPYTIKEAFEFSATYKQGQLDKLEKIKSWGITMGRNDIDEVFSKIIYPLCVSKGAEWFTTAATVKMQVDEYLSLETPTIDGLLDFIAIAEESYIGRNTDAKITLTTVHKAKGRDFDIVIYLPGTSTGRTSFVDIIVESILKSNGIDAKKELEEESLRVDFVAFTRAKEKLFVIADDRNSRNYHIENLSEIEIDDKEKEEISTRLNNRLAEAYSLFLAGRIQDSEKLLKQEDRWLEEYIVEHFRNIDHFSYSAIKTDPYDYLTSRIIRRPFFSPAADFGTAVHDVLKKVVKEETKIDGLEDDVQRAIQNALSALDQLKSEHPGMKNMGTEVECNVRLNSLVECKDEKLIFTGNIDAVFKHNDGYLIVDYKTDKNDGKASDHKRQLSVYKKMYSMLNNIEEGKIKTFVIFIALRGGINTGKFDWKIEKEGRNVLPTFLNHLKTIVDWQEDPKKFIKDLLDNPHDDLLYHAIREKLLQTV